MTREQHGAYRLKQYPGVPLSFLPDQFAQLIIDNLNSPFLPKICTAGTDYYAYLAPVPARNPRIFPHLQIDSRDLCDHPLCYFDKENHTVQLPFPKTVPVGVLWSDTSSQLHGYTTYESTMVRGYGDKIFYLKRETFIDGNGVLTQAEPRIFSQSTCDWNNDQTGYKNYQLFVLAPPDPKEPFTLITNPLLPFTLQRFLTKNSYPLQRKVVNFHMDNQFPNDPRCNSLAHLLSFAWNPLVSQPFPSQALL